MCPIAPEIEKPPFLRQSKSKRERAEKRERESLGAGRRSVGLAGNRGTKLRKREEVRGSERETEKEGCSTEYGARGVSIDKLGHRAGGAAKAAPMTAQDARRRKRLLLL